MAFSVSPSVIVREVDATAVVPAVATPPAAIAGVFRWGPVGERVLVTSENELVSRFGKPYANTSWSNAETFFTAADYLAYSNNLYVTRVDNSAQESAGTYFSAKYPGTLGDNIEVSFVRSANFEENIITLGEVTGTFAFNSNTVTVSSGTLIPEIDAEVGDIIRVGNDSIGYQNMIVSAPIVTANTVDANTGLVEEITYEMEFANRYTLPVSDASTLTFTKKWGKSSLVGGAPSATNGMHIVVTDAGGGISGSPGTVLEVYENVSTDSTSKTDDGSSNYFETVIDIRSNWIKVNALATGNTAPDPITSTTDKYERLTGGTDGNGEAEVSLAALGAGYDLYKNANEVDISFILQGKGNTTLVNGIPQQADLANYIVSNIIDERKDCVLFISPPKAAVVDVANDNTKVNAIIGYRNAIQTSSYWFMDSGYKYRYDKYNDVYRWVPLNGDMAGLASRTEPWESPAGYKRGVIKNVVKLAFNPNKAQRDILYGSNVNPVISQVGQGIVLFGDKTGLGVPSAFDRINVRRLFISVEKAIATTAQSFLFDFNDEFTQTQFRNVIEPFLRDIQGRRGIIDFRIVSDSTVNTPDIIDQNKFRANIFIKPARSINVIELTFVATRTGVEFDEIVGAIA